MGASTSRQKQTVDDMAKKVAAIREDVFARNNAFSIHDLEHTEQLRHMVLNLMRNGASKWTVLTAWHGTAVKWACESARFVVTVFVFLSVRIFIIAKMSNAGSVEDAHQWVTSSVPRNCSPTLFS
jgi:hypothetical protein